MIETGAIDRLLHTRNIFEYKGDPVADAREVRDVIDTFSMVNDIIQNPVKARRSATDILYESYTANLKILARGLAPKGLEVNLKI